MDDWIGDPSRDRDLLQPDYSWPDGIPNVDDHPRLAPPGTLPLRHWRVEKDGQVLFTSEATGTTGENECFVWILRHQGQSYHYATTYGGYRVRPVIEEATTTP